MLDSFISEKASQISYSQDERSNIATTSNHLREIVRNQADFNESFLGGSYKRGTMVKGISDVDVYFQYTGIADSREALTRLRACLVTSYPRTEVKRDHPSIHVDFDWIPFNITPFKKDTWSQQISIPDLYSRWEQIRFGELETAITALRAKNPAYIDLIKILKLWNKSYNRGLKNFDIEWRVANMFTSSYWMFRESISEWLNIFFNNQGFYYDANRFNTLMIKNTYSASASILKSEWLKFIENK